MPHRRTLVLVPAFAAAPAAAQTPGLLPTVSKIRSARVPWVLQQECV